MRLELKSMFSSDFDEKHWWPENDESFSFWVQIMIGPKGQAGYEQIQARVCTPKWLVSNMKESEIILGRTILVARYDWDAIKNEVERWLSVWEASSWSELALIASRIGAWEFDDKYMRSSSRSGESA
jgi:hypothetical protein